MNQSLTIIQSKSKFLPIESINSQIEDELDFHISCKVDELVEAGFSPTDAKAKAESMFGVRSDIVRECQKINYGNRILIERVAIATLIGFMFAVGWLGHELISEKTSNSALTEKLLSITKLQNETSVIGFVVDDKKKPVVDAKVLLVVKTWPNNRFNMESFSTTTDEKGNFKFNDVFNKDQKAEFNITAISDGLQLTSKYIGDHAGSPLAPVSIRLKPATTQVLDIGQMFAGWKIFPNVRTSRGVDHFVYASSKAEFDFTVDKNGQVKMNCFAPGDTVRFIIHDGDDVDEVELKIPGGETAESSNAKVGDVAGKIIGVEGNPIADAKVIVVAKTWPNGRFDMGVFRATTNEEGKFLLKRKFKKNGKSEFLVTVLVDGWAMDSQYVENPNGKALDPIDFELEPAVTKTFTLKLDDGTPAKSYSVFPASCTKEDGRNVLLYPAAQKYVKFKTDANGQVNLNYFAEGDVVELRYARKRSEGAIKIEIDKSNDQNIDIE